MLTQSTGALTNRGYEADYEMTSRRGVRPAVRSITVALATLGCVVSGTACSQEQLAREAEARAKRWGVPAVRITRDVVYAEYGQRRLKLDVYRPP